MSKFTVTPLQQGRFISIEFDSQFHFGDFTRIEATELRDALTRALRKTRNPQ